MEEIRVVIIMCDECGFKTENRRETISFQRDGEGTYHICYDCLKDFAEKVKQGAR